jgi:hypothetical protein
MSIHFPHRRSAALLLASLLLLTATVGCFRDKKRRAEGSSPMGSPVYVGPLTVTALESEWKESLDTGSGTREPKNRFLLIRVTATNGGGAEAALPLLNLVDSKGNTYLEEDKGEGVPTWLGLLRILRPAQTEDGHLLFDVPPASYKLRVTTGGDPEQEMSALIDIPFRLESLQPGGGTELINPVPQPQKQ